LKNVIKMHPLMFFIILKPYLLFGIVPSMYSVLNLFNVGKNSEFYYYQFFVLLCVLLLIEIKRKSLKIEVFEKFLVIKKGLYFNNESKMQSKITALYIKQNPIERLFSAKTVFINTMSDGKKNCEFKFVLNMKNAEILEEFIQRKADLRKKRIPFLKVMFWVAASSNIFEGVLLFTPLIRNVSKLLGIKVYDTIFSQITDKLRFTDKYLPTTVNMITVLFVFIYFVGFLYELLKNLKMQLRFDEKSISVKSGVIVKRKTILNSCIKIGFCAEQSILMRIAGRQAVKAITGGYVGKFSGAALVLPSQTDEELKNSLGDLFADYIPPKSYIEKKKAIFGIFSAILLPVFLSLALIITATILILIFNQFKRFIIFALLGFVFLLALYVYILFYGYKNSRISLEKNITAEGTRRFKIKRMLLRNDRIACFKLRQNLFDRKRGSCKVTLTAYSKGVEKTTIRWINKTELIKNIEKVE